MIDNMSLEEIERYVDIDENFAKLVPEALIKTIEERGTISSLEREITELEERLEQVEDNSIHAESRLDSIADLIESFEGVKSKKVEELLSEIKKLCDY